MRGWCMRAAGLEHLHRRPDSVPIVFLGAGNENEFAPVPPKRCKPIFEPNRITGNPVPRARRRLARMKILDVGAACQWR
jgi:hypothetical protein